MTLQAAPPVSPPTAPATYVDSDGTTRFREVVPRRVPVPKPRRIGISSRYLPQTSVQDAVTAAKAAGFDAIQWAVERGALVDPARVERDLALAVAATRRAGLSVDSVETRLQDARSPGSESILKTLKANEISRYSAIEPFVYDLRHDPAGQLKAIEQRLAAMGELNARYDTTVCYRNRSGPADVGGACWDLWIMLWELGSPHLAFDYDAGHGALSNGRTGWLDLATIALPTIKSLTVSDAAWVQHNGVVAFGMNDWEPVFTPLGEGMAPLRSLLELLGDAGRFDGPVNIDFSGRERLPANEDLRSDLRYFRDLALETRFMA